MKRGKFIVFEGVLGAGHVLTGLMQLLEIELKRQGEEVIESMSVSSKRAQALGHETMTGWRFGDFLADFYLECGARAKLCNELIRPSLDKGKTVLCRHFTPGSMVDARLEGHGIERDMLGVIEGRARGAGFQSAEGYEVRPDLVIFIDLEYEEVKHQYEAAAIHEAERLNLIKGDSLKLSIKEKLALIDGEYPEMSEVTRREQFERARKTYRKEISRLDCIEIDGNRETRLVIADIIEAVNKLQ